MSSDAITLIAITTVGWQEGVGIGEEDWERGRNEEKAIQGAEPGGLLSHIKLTSKISEDIPAADS